MGGHTRNKIRTLPTYGHPSLAPQLPSQPCHGPNLLPKDSGALLVLEARAQTQYRWARSGCVWLGAGDTLPGRFWGEAWCPPAPGGCTPPPSVCLPGHGAVSALRVSNLPLHPSYEDTCDGTEGHLDRPGYSPHLRFLHSVTSVKSFW